MRNVVFKADFFQKNFKRNEPETQPFQPVVVPKLPHEVETPLWVAQPSSITEGVETMAETLSGGTDSVRRF